ncbi:MAG: fumarate hydratase, partial [Notoacmeibacter sp.]
MANSSDQLPDVNLFPHQKDTTQYRQIGGSEFVTIEKFKDQEIIGVRPEALTLLSETAFAEINHFLRSSHLAQLAHILKDPEATENDRFVAFDLMKNANISAGGVLPMCQDTGTAIIMGKKGRNVWTNGSD